MEKRKRRRSAPLALAILLLVFGIMYFIFIALGYTLFPVNRLAPAIMSTVITAAMVLLTVVGVRGRNVATRRSRIASAFMPLCALIFVIGKAFGYDTDGIELSLLPVYGCIALICGLLLFFAHVREKRTGIFLGGVYCIAMIPMFIIVLFWDFGPQQVVRSETSPNAAYLAEVVNSDQGLFGRNTIVRVTEQGRVISIPVGELRKDPIQVYKGEYGESETMTIRWESDDTLYVNGSMFTLS